jgi:hypothetical protein
MKNSRRITKVFSLIFNFISNLLYGGKNGIAPKETKW